MISIHGILFLILAAILLVDLKVHAELNVQGEVSVDFKQFQHNSKKSDDDDIDTVDQNLAASLQFNSLYERKSDYFKLSFYSMKDFKEKDRNLIRIEQGHYSSFLDNKESLKVLLGYNIYKWSIMEAFKLANIVNSPDYTSFAKDLKYRGELVLELEKNFDFGDITFYFFPRFESPFYLGKMSRVGPEVSFENHFFVSDQKFNELPSGRGRGMVVPQFGFLYKGQVKEVSLTLFSLYHIDRKSPIHGTHQYKRVSTIDDEKIDDPPDLFDEVSLQKEAITLTKSLRTQEDDDNEGTCEICYFPNMSHFKDHPRSYFIRVFELGTSIEFFYRNTTFKFEGVLKDFEKHDPILGYQEGIGDIVSFGYEALRVRKNYAHLAIGAEKSFTLFNNQETIFFLEFTRIFGLSSTLERKEAHLFQGDIFLGLRHNFNDLMGKNIDLGFVTDMDSNEKIVRLSYAQRLSNQWKFKAEASFIHAPMGRETIPQGLQNQHKDHSGLLNLTYYF